MRIGGAWSARQRHNALVRNMTELNKVFDHHLRVVFLLVVIVENNALLMSAQCAENK
jgi:hypothetical protein